MKSKDIIQLVIALVILVVSGLVIYSQLGPKPSTTNQNQPSIVVVTPIPTDYDQDALNKLTDSTKAKDFYASPDLKSGLGNSQLFGQ